MLRAVELAGKRRELSLPFVSNLLSSNLIYTDLAELARKRRELSVPLHAGARVYGMRPTEVVLVDNSTRNQYWSQQQE